MTNPADNAAFRMVVRIRHHAKLSFPATRAELMLTGVLNTLAALLDDYPTEMTEPLPLDVTAALEAARELAVDRVGPDSSVALILDALLAH